jgi:hypothetical protein
MLQRIAPAWVHLIQLRERSYAFGLWALLELASQPDVLGDAGTYCTALGLVGALTSITLKPLGNMWPT